MQYYTRLRNKMKFVSSDAFLGSSVGSPVRSLPTNTIFMIYSVQFFGPLHIILLLLFPSPLELLPVELALIGESE